LQHLTGCNLMGHAEFLNSRGRHTARTAITNLLRVS